MTHLGYVLQITLITQRNNKEQYNVIKQGLLFERFTLPTFTLLAPTLLRLHQLSLSLDVYISLFCFTYTHIHTRVDPPLDTLNICL